MSSSVWPNAKNFAGRTPALGIQIHPARSTPLSLPICLILICSAPHPPVASLSQPGRCSVPPPPPPLSVQPLAGRASGRRSLPRLLLHARSPAAASSSSSGAGSVPQREVTDEGWVDADGEPAAKGPGRRYLPGCHYPRWKPRLSLHASEVAPSLHSSEVAAPPISSGCFFPLESFQSCCSFVAWSIQSCFDSVGGFDVRCLCLLPHLSSCEFIPFDDVRFI